MNNCELNGRIVKQKAISSPGLTRNEYNRVKRLAGKHPKLEKCPKIIRSLGLVDIRNSFGNDALLITKGSFIYNVTKFPELYKIAI